MCDLTVEIGARKSMSREHAFHHQSAFSPNIFLPTETSHIFLELVELRKAPAAAATRSEGIHPALVFDLLLLSGVGAERFGALVRIILVVRACGSSTCSRSYRITWNIAPGHSNGRWVVMIG
jgi:hypothetical protein